MSNSNSNQLNEKCTYEDKFKIQNNQLNNIKKVIGAFVVDQIINDIIDDEQLQFIACDCNLRCKYCFDDGECYYQQKILSSLDIAKKCIEFLIKNSGPRNNIDVDFFGGEPILNINIIKKTVSYARSIEKQYNKNFRFTITTKYYKCYIIN